MHTKRPKGVTFKLVHQSYDDAEHDAAVLVEEKELRKHLPSAAAIHRSRQRREDFGEDESVSVRRWAREWDITAEPTPPSTEKSGVVQLPDEDAYTSKRNLLRAQDSDDETCSHDSVNNNNDDDDDRLFDDQEEVEFTDDFLREVIFGDTEEECDKTDALDDNIEDNKRSEESVYIRHDVTKRGVDRQFARMMREFNVDARLNDAYTDDPRTHGALEVKHYLRALEEFVVDKAGIDYDTAEPLRNKGLIHQLKGMVLNAGTDMGPKGEFYTTTVLPDKQARFMAEFQRIKEEIRQAARQRIEERQSRTDTKDEEDRKTLAERNDVEDDDDDDDVYVVREVKDRTHQLDCETAISACSTYFNQPNVIRAPDAGKRRKRRGATSSSVQQPNQSGTEGVGDEDGISDLGTQLLTFERCKGETKEEKKLRQQLVKQAQRERRGKKQELKRVYKNLETDEMRRLKEMQMAKKTVHFF